MSSAAWRFAKIATVASVTFVAVVGLAHMPVAQPLLRRATAVVTGGGCPLGYDKTLTVEQKEASRRQFSATHRGAVVARERPALGFVLDKSTKTEVLAWASTHHVACTAPQVGADLECKNVPSELLPAAYRGAELSSLWLNFGADDKLVAASAIRRADSAQVIAAAFHAVTSTLDTDTGAVAEVKGDSSAQALAAGSLRQTRAEHRLSNYYASTSATNMGDHFVLSEEYRSLTP